MKKITKKGLLALLITIRQEIDGVLSRLPEPCKDESELRNQILTNLDSLLRLHSTPPDISKIYDLFKV